MKTKKIFAVIISVMMLFSCLVVNADSFPPQNSSAWKNLTNKQADNLLKSKNESFIFFFYRDSCPNSKKSITALIKYANKNDISMCGLNVTEYPSWNTWAQFLAPGTSSIGFPFVIVYNSLDKLTASADCVYTVNDLEKLLKKVNMMPGSAGIPTQTTKALFKDVPLESPYYEAVSQLATDDVLSGYDDGTFKPDNTISRTEAAVVIVRAKGITVNNSKNSKYSDVADNFWGKPYIMAASDEGILSGVGSGKFAPQNKVTGNQIIKMLVCMAGLEEQANKNGGWPNGYLKVASNTSIIDSTTYNNFVNGNSGNEPATRGQVAQWTYNARRVNKGNDLKVNGEIYRLGMNSADLHSPDEILPSVNGFSWHVYGSDTYEKFFAAGVADDKVVALVSTGIGFEYKGYRAGQTITNSSENSSEFLLDENDKNIIHGVLMLDNEYRSSKVYNEAALLGESKMNFHCTNGFRVYHKMEPYKWDDDAAEAARLHSVDMATNNYFEHTGLDGRNMGDRMRAQGVNWTTCSENIAAGNSLGVTAYDAWVNSSGHRKNILGSCTHLGVGFAYNTGSVYRFYSTQNFYARANAFDTFFN